ncbi:MAG: hypothetical protein WCP61_04075, partial [Chitinophagia bacterium]
RFAQNVFLNGGRTQTLSTIRTAVFRFAQNVFLNGGRTQTLSTFSLCEYVGFFNAHLLIQSSLIRISH